MHAPPDARLIVFAACHCEGQAVEALIDDFLDLRQEWGLPRDYAFKHTNSSPKVVSRYCDVLMRHQVEFTILVIDKSSWPEGYLRYTRGNDRIVDAIAGLMGSMGDSWVAGHKLMIDANRSERGLLTNIRQAASVMRKNLGSQSFRKVAALPDHRMDAVLIQTADMIAGEIRSYGGSLHSIPKSLRNRINVVSSEDLKTMQKPHR